MDIGNKWFAGSRYQGKMLKSDLHGDRVKKIAGMLPRGGKLLEVGAWDGSTVRFYKKFFHGEISGLDINLEVMRPAMDALHEARACDLGSELIPWADKSFDVVICSEIIEHVFDTDGLLRELYRILKPGGQLIISTPNLASLLNRFFLLFGLQPLGTEVSTEYITLGNPFRQNLKPSGHIRSFTCRAFKEIVMKHNFIIEQKKGAGITTRKYLRCFERMAGNLFCQLGSVIILSARKPL